MNQYELTVVLKGSATPAKIKGVSEKIEKLIAAHDGKIDKTTEWGKIELSYSIKKEKEGNFVHYLLSLNSSGAKDLSLKLKLEGDIIRYLLIKKNG